MSDWRVCAGTAVLLWGVMGFLQKLAVAKLGWQAAALLNMTFEWAIILACTTRSWPAAAGHAHSGIILAAAAGLCGGLAFVTYNRALSSAPVSLVAPIVNLNPAVTVVLAVLLLGERLTAAQGAGFVLAASGLFLMSK